MESEKGIIFKVLEEGNLLSSVDYNEMTFKEKKHEFSCDVFYYPILAKINFHQQVIYEIEIDKSSSFLRQENSQITSVPFKEYPKIIEHFNSFKKLKDFT